MSTVKIDKDVFVRDKYGIRVRMFVAGTEVDEVKYNEAFRQNVPVDAKVLPQKPVFVGEELTHGEILPENKEMFVESEAPVAKAPKAEVAKAEQAEQTEVVGEPTAEVEAQEDTTEDTKTAKTSSVKAKK